MGRAPCCDKTKVKRGPWSPEEDTLLKNFIFVHGTGGNWISLPGKAGLNRCGKSCRLRWLNYLRPDIKHGGFTDEEDYLICNLYSTIGSRWSVIASKLPGRTDNDVKNYWNTKLKKKIIAGKVADFDNKLLSGTNPKDNNNNNIDNNKEIESSSSMQTAEPLEICNGVNSGGTNSSVSSLASSSVQQVGNGEELVEDDIDDFWMQLFVDQSTFIDESSSQEFQNRHQELVNELASVVRGPG